MRAKAIEEHPNGRRYLKYREKGKLHRIYLGTTDREVKKKLREVRASHEAGRLLDDGRATSRVITPNGPDINLKEIIVKHLEFTKGSKADETFILRQRNLLYLLEFLGPCPVSSITADDLQRFADWIKSKHSRTKTSFHAIRECRTLFHWANRAELINFPMSRFPVGSEPRAEIKRFTTDEISKLLAVASGEFGDMIHFGSMMGLRPKELRELRHDQIQWDAKPRPMLDIDHHKTMQTSRVPIPRSVPLSKEAEEILRHQRIRHPHSKLVFLNGKGQPYERTVLRNRLLRLCRKAKIEEKSPYSLRHYAGTQWAQLTGLSTVAHLLGHSSVNITMRYLKRNEPAHYKAVDDLAKLVEGLGTKPEGNVVAFEKRG